MRRDPVAEGFHVHVCPEHGWQVGRSDDHGWLCREGHAVPLPLHVDVVRASELALLRSEVERLREAGEKAAEVLGACHLVEEGPNARWVEFPDASDAYFEDDLVCRADCPVCIAANGLRLALAGDSTPPTRDA